MKQISLSLGRFLKPLIGSDMFRQVGRTNPENSKHVLTPREYADSNSKIQHHFLISISSLSLIHTHTCALFKEIMYDDLIKQTHYKKKVYFVEEKEVFFL